MNDYANTTPGNALGTNLGVEAVAEFSVLTNSYSAEYGRTSGGVINAITRSGTNQIRGTVFEFHRNSAMDAKDYFDRGSSPPPFRRNQYGVAFGGPLVKNRTFWFADYEGLREMLGQTTISTTLSAAARQGGSPPARSPSTRRSRGRWRSIPLPNGALLGNGDTGQYFAVRNQRIARRLRAGQARSQAVARRAASAERSLYDDALRRTAGRVPEQAGGRSVAAAGGDVRVLAHLRFGDRQRQPCRHLAVDIEQRRDRRRPEPGSHDLSLGYIPGSDRIDLRARTQRAPAAVPAPPTTPR